LGFGYTLSQFFLKVKMSQIEYEDLPKYTENKINIIGCDECGYGSAISILVVCGVKVPKDWNLEGLNDSKKLSEKKRNIMRDKLLQDNNISFHIAERSNKQIDEFGLGVMLKDAYKECFTKLSTHDSLIVCDGILKFDSVPSEQVSIIKGDTLVPAVMAASILGKTYRDDFVRSLDKEYPQYNWKKNIGYLTKDHLSAISKYGFSPYHRLSYNLKSLDKYKVIKNDII